MPLWAVPASAGASARPAVTLTGSVGRLPAASGVVLVEAELALGRSAGRQHAATKLQDMPVADAKITGPSFRVAVPDSATLRRAEKLGHGIVNFDIVVDSGSSGTAQYVAAALTSAAAPGSTAVEAQLRSRVVSVPRFPRFKAMDARMRRTIEAAGGLAAVPDDGPFPCNWSRFRGLTHHETKIGQVHVANVGGVSDDYKYTTRDDATVSVGVSASPSSHYSASGSVTLTDSLSASGHLTFGKGAVHFVETLMYYQRYRNNNGISCPAGIRYKVQADHSAGNVAQGSGSPSKNPFGGCRRDKNGFIPLPPSGGFQVDRAKSATVGGATALYGLNVSASAGFTSDILEDYEASKKAGTSYICGSRSLPDVPIIYNS
jgi:hypothetical protein